MARMIPDYLSADCPQSERYVFNRFKDELPENWIVIHGRRFLLPGATRPQEGEVDFLVLDPDRGMLGLEVKGGGVERTQNGWYSTDRNANRHQIKDPGAQSSSATHAIYKFLNNSNGFGGRGYRCRTGWGVVLPDVSIRKSLGPDLPREIVFDREDLADPFRSIDRAFKFCGLSGPQLTQAAVGAMLDALLPTFNLIPSLAARFQQDHESLIRLTDEQTDILDMLEATNRAAVQGTAGTGKTLLALEKARRLADEGHRTLLLCYNRPLADELRKSAESFEVETFHGFCSSKARLAKLSFVAPKGEDQQRFWNDDAPLTLLEALEGLPNDRYDAIVVDEAQDFRENWWPSVEEALRDPMESTLYVFFDPLQNIYGGGPPKALNVAPVKLVYNCRNTTRIAEYSADIVGIGARVRTGSPQGADVEVYQCKTDRAMVEQLRKILHQFVVEQNIDCEQIVVLTARSVTKSVVSKSRKIGNFRLVDYDRKKGSLDVGFTTLQRFKGLESDVVILIDVEPGTTNCSPGHLYVGASRARHLLVVLTNTREEGVGK